MAKAGWCQLAKSSNLLSSSWSLHGAYFPVGVDRWYKNFHTLRLLPFVHSYAYSPNLLIADPLCLFLLRPLRRQSYHWPWPRNLYLFSPWATSPFAQGVNSDALLTAPFMRQPHCLSDPFLNVVAVQLLSISSLHQHSNRRAMINVNWDVESYRLEIAVFSSFPSVQSLS